MRITSFSNGAALDRLRRVNTELTSFLRSSSAKPDNTTQSSGPASRLAGRDTLSADSRRTIASSLLSSVATAADSVAESRATLGRVRRQLETILGVAVKAAQNRLSSAEEAQGQATINRAIAEINRLHGDGKRPANAAVLATGNEAAISALPLRDGTTVSGVNNAQLVDFVVSGISPNSTETISGTLFGDQSAELFYDGNAASLIFDTGQFTVSGSLGSASITFNRNESLSGLAGLINEQTGSTGVRAVVSNGNLAFQSLETGSPAHISVSLDYNKLIVSGVNSSQVAAFDVQALQPGTNNTISGFVTKAAQQAEQTYVGQSGRITNSATFELTGNLGSATVAIQRGELLTDVAGRVNQATSTTGVTASVQGDNLVFKSVSYGSAANFSVEVSSLVDVAGVNDDQFVDFQVDSIAPNSHQTISGRALDAAQQAQLKYSGGAGSVIKNDASFDVAGSVGSASFTVTADESLSDVAARINQHTGATGVTATVENNDLFLSSVDYGTDAHVFVEVTSGSFDVQGGSGFNGGEIDYGEDVRAEINGTDYFGNGNRISFSDGFGSFTLEFADDFEGDFDLISVVSASTEDVVNISDVNGNQFTGFQVTSIDPGDHQTISGNVVDAAEQAQLKYSGGAGSVIKDDASFDVAGNLGSASFTVTKDESLSDVAARINAETGLTGVTATVDGNDLFLNSADYGTAALAFVEVTSGDFDVHGGSGFNGGEIDYGSDVKAKINGVDYFGNGNQLLHSQGSGTFALNFVAGFEGSFDTIDVASTIGADNLTDGEHVNTSGVNKDHFVSFQVDSAIPDSIQTVSGSVIDAAEQAQLTYTGGAGSVIKDFASFVLAGNEGSASFTVIMGESLSDVAERINQKTGVTGVTATVDNNDLLLNSVDYGADAQTFVQVTIGTFDVQGGSGFNGGEIDYGRDVKAKINGVDYFGDGNLLSFSDASGSFSVEFVPGVEGDFDTVAVGSINNGFDLNGGNGDGTANGVDAEGVINGQSLTASGRRFSFSDSLGSYTLDVAGGFVGTIDPISIASSPTAYAIDGGNGDGTADGQDAHLVINGQTLTGVNNRYAYDSDTGSYVFEFVDGFSGPFDEIEVSSPASAVLGIIGGNGDGTARGSDTAFANAANVSFSVFDQLQHLGTFSFDLDAASLGGAKGNIQQLATGGSKSGLGSHATDAVRVTQHALAHVASIESMLDLAAKSGLESISESTSSGAARDARLSALAVRDFAGQADLGLFGQLFLDPQRVLGLLHATTT